MFYRKRCYYKVRKIYSKAPVPAVFLNKVAGVSCTFCIEFFGFCGKPCDFCDILTNNVFNDHLKTTASDFFEVLRLFKRTQDYWKRLNLRILQNTLT